MRKLRLRKRHKEGRWVLHQLHVKGYCRVCWKKFDVEFTEDDDMTIDGWTLEDIQNAVGKRLKCCSNPDIRFIPV